jgi:hypothetical protein
VRYIETEGSHLILNATVTTTTQIDHTVPEEVEVFSRFFRKKKELTLVVSETHRRGNLKRS